MQLKMKRGKLITKETKDILRSKAGLILLVLLSLLIGYSFYMAVDLYSKASLAALHDPLYATGFEPVPGVFVPTFGGFFVLFSMLAPFVLIKLITDEKKYGTFYLIAQYPFSIYRVFLSKVIAGIFFLLVSLSLLLPSFVYWRFLGGHIPICESMLLLMGYFLYGLFVLSVSLFSASLFEEGAQAAIFALFVIMLSWFVDFGKDMHLLAFLEPLSAWSITRNLKFFEEGIFSLKVVLYFLGLSSLFTYLASVFFDAGIRRKSGHTVVSVVVFLLFMFLIAHINYNFDLTESHRNSFSPAKTAFLKKLPEIRIKIYLDPTDSRAKDFENDFLKRLRLVKRDVKIEYAKSKELEKNYGFFVYSLGRRSMKTYSNSEEEIFMVLQDLSGLKLKEDKKEMSFRGYPLVAKGKWKLGVLFVYVVLLPITLMLVYILLNRTRRGGEYV